MKNERVSVRISTEIKEWYEMLSKKTGVSRSSLMAMAMYEWKTECEKKKRKTFLNGDEDN